MRLNEWMKWMPAYKDWESNLDKCLFTYLGII